MQQYRRKGKRYLKDVAGARHSSSYAPRRPRNRHIELVVVYRRGLGARAASPTRSALRSLGITAAVFLVITAIYMLFLRPDETTRMRYRYEQNAEQNLSAGDPAAALSAVDQALTYVPGDGDLLVLRAVALTALNREEEAETVFATARTKFEDDTIFYSTRAQAYLVANRPDLALIDTQRILEIDANSAFAYFQMGNANAGLGNYFEAVSSYETAGELARASGQTELEGMARVQLANLMDDMMSPRWTQATQPRLPATLNTSPGLDALLFIVSHRPGPGVTTSLSRHPTTIDEHHRAMNIVRRFGCEGRRQSP